MTSPPQNISYSAFIYIIHQKVTYSWADMTPILSCYDYYTPFNGKLKKKCYILCKFGYTPYSEAPPHIY